MFRKLTSRSSTSENVAFDDNFWVKYIDSFNGAAPIAGSGVLTPSSKKYTGLSSAVMSLSKYFDTLGLPIPPTNQIIALLKSPFTQGDLVRTFHLIRFFQLSTEGLFITNSPIDKFNCHINYVGAENWENVMCYLDSMLFAMFSTLESFEPILFISNHHVDKPNQHPITQLSSLLRVYVNMLRSGNLITTDITAQLCELLGKLGFTEAISHKQQDAASFFEFLTEVLSMPLLTFKVDIKHGGKFNKDDDEKISKERILFVSIPDDDDELYSVQEAEKDDSPPPSLSSNNEDPKNRIPRPVEELDDILLEECLEHYFNNSISVKRELERRATMESIRRSVIPEGGVVTVNESNEDLEPKSRTSLTKSSPVHEGVRTRSSTLSIWSTDATSNTSKEVSLPAWMFLKLLPFYTDINDVDGTARNSKEFVNRRPVLPICLKRYSFDTDKVKANRSHRRVIIPPIINLPDFVADDDEDSVGLFKLILESVVCHRGLSINLGHFVAATRKNYNNTKLTNEEATNATWHLFDDMNLKGRVVEKTFKEIFDKEWPYMLFYRLVANDPASTDIIPPEGFRTKYWAKEDNLSPVLSEGTLQMLSATNSPALSGQDSTIADSEKNRITSVHSSSSVSIPDIAPSNPSFVDIRNKYFWYVTDKDNNYYKEIGEVSKNDSSRSSIAISPQFRRNSQWSFNTNVSSINDLMEENRNNIDKNTVESSRFKLFSSSKSLLPEVQVSLDTTPPSKTENRPAVPAPLKKEEKKQKTSQTKRKLHSKRREAYRKEKCVIT